MIFKRVETLVGRSGCAAAWCEIQSRKGAVAARQRAGRAGVETGSQRRGEPTLTRYGELVSLRGTRGVAANWGKNSQNIWEDPALAGVSSVV